MLLMRCARGMIKGPVGLAAGMVFATGVAAGVTLGVGLAGAALVGKRLWEERQGWRSGAPDAARDAEAAAEAPGL